MHHHSLQYNRERFRRPRVFSFMPWDWKVVMRRLFITNLSHMRRSDCNPPLSVGINNSCQIRFKYEVQSGCLLEAGYLRGCRPRVKNNLSHLRPRVTNFKTKLASHTLKTNLSNNLKQRRRTNKTNGLKFKVHIIAKPEAARIFRLNFYNFFQSTKIHLSVYFKRLRIDNFC